MSRTGTRSLCEASVEFAATGDRLDRGDRLVRDRSRKWRGSMRHVGVARQGRDEHEHDGCDDTATMFRISSLHSDVLLHPTDIGVNLEPRNTGDSPPMRISTALRGRFGWCDRDSPTSGQNGRFGRCDRDSHVQSLLYLRSWISPQRVALGYLGPPRMADDGIQSLLSLVCAVDARCSRARLSRHCEAPVGLPVSPHRTIGRSLRHSSGCFRY